MGLLYLLHFFQHLLKLEAFLHLCSLACCLLIQLILQPDFWSTVQICRILLHCVECLSRDWSTDCQRYTSVSDSSLTAHVLCVVQFCVRKEVYERRSCIDAARFSTVSQQTWETDWSSVSSQLTSASLPELLTMLVKMVSAAALSYCMPVA